MATQTILSKRLKRKATIELILAAFVTLSITYLSLALEFEAFELLYEFTRDNEDYDLDEALLIFFYVSIAGTIYGMRRSRDIKALNKEISQLAFYDDVTGLPNRALAMDRLQQLLTQAEKNDKEVAVVFIDFDNFKTINDTYGHAQGDFLLKLVSKRLKESVRASDTIGRLGGDEFLLLFEFEDRAELNTVNQELIHAQRLPYKMGSAHINVTFSIGVAVFPQDGSTSTELLKAADTAMYHTKQSGKDDVSYFTEAMGKQLAERYLIETGLKTAIDNQEFHIEYQPQACLHTGQLKGYEALLRWKKDNLVISPADFIEIAEESGQIEKVGAWVLTQAITEMKPVLEDHQRLSINISPRQFHQKNLVALVVQQLEQLDFPAHQLELEITESAIISNLDETIDKISQFKQQGINISIDDFGTGYSSLGRLRELAVNGIKIDKSFIAQIAQTDRDAKLVESIVVLAKNMNMEIIAEGVETQAQLDKLIQLNCDAIQGYLYARPMPISTLIKDQQNGGHVNTAAITAALNKSHKLNQSEDNNRKQAITVKEH